jgi:tartrate-resistant acid phosphatase type 5
MNAKCGQDGCDAVLLAGDNFYDDGVTGTDDPLWVKAFEEPYDRPELNKIPFYAVLGNHDYSPTILKQIVDSKGVKQAQIDYSYLPVGQGANTRKTDKWTMPAPYYDVQFGEGLVHVFGMDSVDAGEFSGAAQLNDMKQRVNASTAKWKLVFAHHPRFTSGDHQKDNDLLNTVTALFAPSMYELQQGIYCNADLFLSGHDHDREFLDKGQDPMCPNTHFMVSGAGAKVNSKKGSNLAKQLYYNNAIEGFFYLIFSDNELRIESYDMDPQACAAAGLAAPAWSNAPITKP